MEKAGLVCGKQTRGRVRHGRKRLSQLLFTSRTLPCFYGPNYATVLYGFSLHVRTLCLYYVGQYLPGVSISKIGAWKLRSKVIAAFAVVDVDEHLPSLSGHW